MRKKQTVKQDNPARGRGRPEKYVPSVHPVFASALASLGLTEKEIAVKLQVSEATISNWKNKYPEFVEALNVGKIDPDDKVERSLYERAVGYHYNAVKIFQNGLTVKYVEHCPPDTTAQIFWLKNRRPKEWRDRHELTGADGTPMEINARVVLVSQLESMNEKEIADELAKLQQK